jgi:integrase/recombinase XerD
MKTYLDPRDVELLEKCAASARDKLLVRLLFRLGCRVSEVLNLKVGDIDFE